MTDTTNLAMTLVESNVLQPSVPINAALNQLDAAVAGTLSIEFASDANLTLTEAQYQQSALVFTDSPITLTAGRDVILPDHFPHIHVTNSTAQSLTFKKSGQTGVSVSSGQSAMIASGATDVVAVPASGGGVSDGDKGDITVSASGATWTVDNDAITYSKMQNVSATSRVLGRKTAAAGDVEECTLSEVLDMVGSAAQGDILYRGATGWTRLGAGTSGQYLQTQGTGANPQWASGGGGGGLSNFTESVSTSAPNATIPVVSLSATNAATNVDVALKPKGGSGALMAHIPDSTATGGNKRGAAAVDWQTTRTTAAQVASGANAGIPYGARNTASGQGAGAMGQDCTASGEAAIAMGDNMTADASYSHVYGKQGTARGIIGMEAYGGGASVSKQASRLLLVGLTTDGTTADTLTSDNASATSANQFTLPSDRASMFRGMVIARCISGGTVGECKGWVIEGVAKNISGTFSLVGTPSVTSSYADAGASSWSVSVTADNTNKCVKVACTGEASRTIQWSCIIEQPEA